MKEVTLLSNLLETGTNVSFILKYETTVLPALHFIHRDVAVSVNGTSCSFALSYLSPKEVLASIGKVFPANLYSIEVNINGSMFLSNEIFRVVKSSTLHINLINNLKTQGRVLANGSIAVAINEVLRFTLLGSDTFTVFAVETLNRIHHPRLCEKKEKITVLNCRKNATNPVITMQESGFDVAFPVRGLYTIILYMREKRNQKEYKYFVRTANYIVVQEKISSACIVARIIDKKYVTFLAGVTGLSFNFNLKYEWNIRGGGYINIKKFIG